MSEEKLYLYPIKSPGKTARSRGGESRAATGSLEKAEPLKSELEHFIHCVLQRTKPKTDGVEASGF